MYKVFSGFYIFSKVGQLSVMPKPNSIAIINVNINIRGGFLFVIRCIVGLILGQLVFNWFKKKFILLISKIWFKQMLVEKYIVMVISDNVVFGKEIKMNHWKLISNDPCYQILVIGKEKYRIIKNSATCDSYDH